MLPFIKIVISCSAQTMLSIWLCERREIDLPADHVRHLQNKQPGWVSPVVWLPTRSTPPTTHAVCLLVSVGDDPPQDVSDMEELTVFASVRQGDRSLRSRFSDHLPQEICASPHAPHEAVMSFLDHHDLQTLVSRSAPKSSLSELANHPLATLPWCTPSTSLGRH